MRYFKKKVKGVLPIVQEAAKSGIRRVVVPGENAMEAAVIPGITVWGVNCLNDLLAALNHPELETEKVYQPRIRAEDLLGKEPDRMEIFPGSGGTGEC